MRQIFPVCDEAVDLGAIYRPPSLAHGFWRTNMVTTVNGAVEVGGVSRPLSSGADRKTFQVIRAFADAVVIGRGNAIAEGYTSLAAPNLPEEIPMATAAAPKLVVVARSLDGLATAPLAGSDKQVVIATSAARRDEAEHLAQSFKVEPSFLFLGESEIEMGLLRSTLSDLGYRSVVCEGGPTLLGLLLAGGAIDEICLTITPLAAPSHHGGPFGAGGGFGLIQLKLSSVLEEDGTLLYRYGLRTGDRPGQDRGRVP